MKTVARSRAQDYFIRKEYYSSLIMKNEKKNGTLSMVELLFLGRYDKILRRHDIKDTLDTLAYDTIR